MHLQLGGEIVFDLIEKAPKLGMPVPPITIADGHGGGGDVQFRGKFRIPHALGTTKLDPGAYRHALRRLGRRAIMLTFSRSSSVISRDCLAIDFASDVTANGQRLQVLSVVARLPANV
jgi:hypothetical protein